MKTLQETKMLLEKLKPTLKKRFSVERLDVFGSFARNETTEKSDIDLLVTYSTTDYDYFTIFRLRNYLRRKLHRKVDIVSKEFLNRHIKDEVLKKQYLYEKGSDRRKSQPLQLTTKISRAKQKIVE